jgi:hypothetical protein
MKFLNWLSAPSVSRLMVIAIVLCMAFQASFIEMAIWCFLAEMVSDHFKHRFIRDGVQS